MKEELTERKDWVFFEDETGQMLYNELCVSCRNSCKQSYKCVVVFCPEYQTEK